MARPFVKFPAHAFELQRHALLLMGFFQRLFLDLAVPVQKHDLTAYPSGFSADIIANLHQSLEVAALDQHGRESARTVEFLDH